MKSEILNPRQIQNKKSKVQNFTMYVRGKILNFKFRYSNLSKVSCLVLLVMVMSIQTISAETTRTLNSPTPELNPNDPAFKIVVCDGPSLPDSLKATSAIQIKDKEGNVIRTRPYVPCDFNGVMRQVQHLINIMMVLGVLVAIAMFSYAGYLYITGQEANIKKAKAIFPKVFFGFIIMLSAWFIVYQILSWLTNNNGFKSLLGSP